MREAMVIVTASCLFAPGRAVAADHVQGEVEGGKTEEEGKRSSCSSKGWLGQICLPNGG